MAATLTGPELAAALYQAELMPPDVVRLRSCDVWVFWNWDGNHDWRPWECLCCVAYYMARYEIGIEAEHHTPSWSVKTWDMGYLEEVACWAEIPAAISRVALACQQREQGLPQ